MGRGWDRMLGIAAFMAVFSRLGPFRGKDTLVARYFLNSATAEFRVFGILQQHQAAVPGNTCKIAVSGQEGVAVVNACRGDEEIHGRGLEAFFAAVISELGGMGIDLTREH